MESNQENLIDKAANMVRVPLLELDRLIKERRARALEKDAKAVEELNQMIKDLLAL